MEDKLEGRRELIAGINHMGWLLELGGQGRQRPVPRGPPPRIGKNEAAMKDGAEKHDDMVRYGLHPAASVTTAPSPASTTPSTTCTTSSRKYPELIERYNIPLDEYPRRCVKQIAGWAKEYGTS